MSMDAANEHALRAPKHPLAPSDTARNIIPSQAGTKRLFSDRVSRLLDPSDNEDENDPALAPDEIHDEKRSRARDWPLRKASPLVAESPQDQTDPASVHRSLSPTRGSRFLEGSMNDRASKVPPAEFIGEESVRETYARHREKLRAAQQASPAEPAAEKTDAARPSGIFRFGKSLAATFNPANWKIWKPQPEETAQQKALRERRETRERAERIYRELKESGKFRDAGHPPSFHVAEDDGRAVGQDGNRGKHDDIAMKHDSGIAFDDAARSGVTPREEKRRGRVFLNPPNLVDETFSDPYTASRTSLQTTRPLSITQAQPPDPSPRKLRSSSRTGPGSRRRSLSIPRMRKGSITATATTASESEDPSRPANPRRVSSRVDLRKQKRNHKRLVKRVSDLEVKLAAARRDLVDAGGEVLSPPSQSQTLPPAREKRTSKATQLQPPAQHRFSPPLQTRAQPTRDDPRLSRPRFVPGALATLPSERLLSAYVQAEPGQNADPDDGDGDGEEACGEGGTAEELDVDVSQIGRAVSTDYGERGEGFEWPDYVF